MYSILTFPKSPMGEVNFFKKLLVKSPCMANSKPMSQPTRIQQIQRKKSHQYYVGIPSALAHALDLEKGEIVEWTVLDKQRLLLTRHNVTEEAQTGTAKQSGQQQQQTPPPPAQPPPSPPPQKPPTPPSKRPRQRRPDSPM